MLKLLQQACMHSSCGGVVFVENVKLPAMIGMCKLKHKFMRLSGQHRHA